MGTSEWLSIVGIAVSLLGFGLALIQIRKTQTAAESARDSARSATQSIRRLDSVISFASVLRVMDEMKNAIRDGEAPKLPRLFDEARRVLISARETHPSLDDVDQKKIQKALTFFKAIEVDISKMPSDDFAARLPKITGSLIVISDELTQLSAKIRMADSTDGE